MVETSEQTRKPVDGVPSPKAKQAKPSTDYSALMRLSGVALVFLALGLAVGYFIPGLLGGNPSSQTTTNIDQTLLSDKITDYLNTNFLDSQGLSVEINDFTDYTDDLYVVDFEIMDGETVLQAGQLYAAKDGSAVVLGDVLKLDEPLPYADTTTPSEPQSFAQTDRPTVELFIMSFCPYGQQAESNLYDVVDLLGESVDFEPHYILYDNYCGWGVKCQATQEELDMGYAEDAGARADYCFDAENDSPTYCSMHGIGELQEDLRQRCVLMDYPEKFWDYVKHINQDAADDTDYCAVGDDDCWQAAMEAEGIDVAGIEACIEENAQVFVETEKALAEEKGASGSPTILINGTNYTGSRDAESFKTAICSAFTTLPAACSEELGSTASVASGDCGA